MIVEISRAKNLRARERHDRDQKRRKRVLAALARWADGGHVVAHELPNPWKKLLPDLSREDARALHEQLLKGLPLTGAKS